MPLSQCYFQYFLCLCTTRNTTTTSAHNTGQHNSIVVAGPVGMLESTWRTAFIRDIRGKSKVNSGVEADNILYYENVRGKNSLGFLFLLASVFLNHNICGVLNELWKNK